MKLRLILFINAMAFSAIAFVLNAIPASKRPVMIQQPDGTYRQVLLHGDEYSHVITTVDGTRVLRHNADGMLVDGGKFDAVAFNASWKAAPRRLAAPMRIGGATTYPTHGKQRALAVLVQFPQTKEHPEGLSFSGDDPRGLFDDLLNKKGYDHEGATGSVHDYFLESSNGIFDLTFDVYGPITLSKDLAFYGEKIGGEDLNAWNMAKEACEALDEQVDFKQYDRDGDGIIDNVYVFYAGPGAATGGDPAYTIWQHAADVEAITGKQFLFDGVRLNHYACSNEYRIVGNGSAAVKKTEGIGTVCHEFSHVLGLPDVYDTKGGGLLTPGDWSLMDMGCHLNESRTPSLISAYERTMLGWIEPKEIGKKPETVTLRSLSSNECCIIPTVNEHEYFILENRQQQGWDAFIPGHGLLVWHINYMKDYWEYNQVNTQRGNLGIDIVRADGINDVVSGAGDVFPGTANVTELSDEGYPNMLTITGQRTDAPLSNIKEAGGVITFDICKSAVHIDKVSGLAASDITPTGFSALWTLITTSNVGYKINVFSLEDGQKKYVAGYREMIVSGAPVTVEGLQPETTYYFNVTAFSGGVSGEVSDDFKVTTPAMSFKYMKPEVQDAINITADGFTAVWNKVDGAVDYAVNVFTKEKGEPETQTTDFTDGIENIPTGWTTNCSFTMSINGYYGQASPSLSMTDDYSRLQSPVLNGNFRGISFWYRERSTSGKSHLEISGLDSDGNWIILDEIHITESMSKGAVYTLDENSKKYREGIKAVRIVYHRVEKGTLALDDVVVSYNDKFTRNPVDKWNGYRIGSADTSVAIDGLTPSTVYYCTVQGIDATGTFTLESKEVLVTTTDGSGIEHVVTDNDADAPIEYYNLRGMKIDEANLLPGVYLKRQGMKTTKVVVY